MDDIILVLGEAVAKQAGTCMLASNNSGVLEILHDAFSSCLIFRGLLDISHSLELHFILRFTCSR